MIELYDNNYDIEKLWETLLPEWGGVVNDLFRTPESIEQIPDVPPMWIEMLSAKSERNNFISAMWRGIPRFERYLQTSVLDVGVGNSIGGTVMVYLIKDWKETGINEHEPGLMIAGLPSTENMLSIFQENAGEIPAPLYTAWKAHSFSLLKNGRWLGSLRPEGYVISRAPNVISEPSWAWVNEAREKVECLEIFEPGSPISGCLIRGIGEKSWLDYVVYRERSGYINNSHRPSIESTFTDWELNEWIESDL